MAKVRGRLRTAREGVTYRGHRVQLSFQERADLTTLLAAPLDPEIRNRSAEPPAAAPDEIWLPTVRTTEVKENGRFELELPDEKHFRGPFIFTVTSPDGLILYREELDQLPREWDRDVDPRDPFRIDEHPDPFHGRRVRLNGRVLDAGGKRVPAGLRVLLWARPVGAPEDAFRVVLTAETDGQGYFSGDYPRGSFAEAFGQVGPTHTSEDGGPEQKVPIPLEDDGAGGGAFPLKVILVVSLPSEVGFELDTAPPRVPEPEDLVNSPEVYSEDLGGGQCVTFTTPNRTLEEFNFYYIVRTTDPEIKGISIENPQPLPKSIRDVLVRLTEARPASGTLKGEPSPERVREFEFNPEQPLGPVGSDRTEILPLETMQIQPRVLKRILSDPDGFTPTALMTADRISAFQYLRDLLEVLAKKSPERVPVSAENFIDWDDQPTVYQATTIAHGHILRCKQIWRADGYSLGDLLYSLPLAPGQKKQIAVIDWERRESAGRSEALTAEERLAASLSRDRDISEIVHSTLTESMSGGSEASTFGGGVGFGLALKSFVLGVGGGGGRSSSEAWQDASRNLSASSLQQLRDRTLQSASAVRSQRATVVQTVQQGEAVRAQTEVVANYNHCHAMTVEYFEVLRHFQVTQELVDVQECLFVPLLMSAFDAAKALRWREPLQQALRDRDLLGGFDALERIQLNYVGSDLPSGSFAQEPLRFLDGELRLELNIARPRDPLEDESEIDYLQSHWSFWKQLIGGNPADIYHVYLHNQELRDRIFQEQLAPRVARAFVAKLKISLVDNQGHEHPVDLDPTLVSEYRPGIPLYVRLNSRGNVPGLRREQVTGVRIRTEEELPTYSRCIVHEALLRYRTQHLNRPLVSNRRVMNDLLVGDEVYLPTPLDPLELRNPRQEDQALSRRLLAHLNRHLEYYHKAIWLSMDADRRYMLLDGFRIEVPGPGNTRTWRSVASVVENRLLGIVGNAMVLPVARGFHLDPTYRADEQGGTNLLDLYAPTIPTPPMRISVPTRGVFAEAVLGSCNSCEKKDDTRFWRWEESPIPDDPAAILPIDTTSRRAEPPEVTPTPLPAPIVNVQNAPPAPDPTGLAAALQLLGSSDVFRDITGLTENQKNALAAMQAALGTAQFFGGEAAKLAQQKEIATNIDKAMEEIRKAKDAQMITEDQARALTESALRGMIGEERQSRDRLTEQPEIRKLIDQGASGQGQTNVKATRSSGGQTESVDISHHVPSSLLSLFGAGSKPKTIGRRSTKAEALAHVAACRGDNRTGRWRFDRDKMFDRLEALINDPDLVDQDGLNLCGPAAFLRVWLARDPLAVAKFACDLYFDGKASINDYKVEPGDDSLIAEDYEAIKNNNHGVLAPEADWMILGSLRDAENFWFDYEGKPEEDVSAFTTPGELAEWLEATQLYATVKDEGNFYLTKGISHALSLKPSASRDVILLINAHILDQMNVNQGKKKSSDYILGSFPNHFVVLMEEIQETGNGDLHLKCWTWGSVIAGTIARETFAANYYGAVIGEGARP